MAKHRSSSRPTKSIGSTSLLDALAVKDVNSDAPETAARLQAILPDLIRGAHHTGKGQLIVLVHRAPTPEQTTAILDLCPCAQIVV